MLLRFLKNLFKDNPICLSCNKPSKKLERLSERESPSVYQALQVCTSCHTDPRNINQHNVSKNLRSLGYKSEDVDVAFALIRGFKESAEPASPFRRPEVNSAFDPAT